MYPSEYYTNNNIQIFAATISTDIGLCLYVLFQFIIKKNTIQFEHKITIKFISNF